MSNILQQDISEEFFIVIEVITGVREFVLLIFMQVDIMREFYGEYANEKVYISKCADTNHQIEEDIEVVVVDPIYFRPTVVEVLTL